MIADLDIDALAALEIAPDATRLLALVRRDGRPIGIVRLTASGQIPVAQLRLAIDAQVGHASLPRAPAPAPPISIVVCTHERQADLVRCLAGLRPFAERGHEVIVVDNAPLSNRTAEVTALFPYRYLVEPCRGLDNARNCGLRAASHAIVALTDDDAVPDPGWVDAIAAPFADQAVGCVTGLVLPLELETPAQEQFEVYCTQRRVFQQRVFRRTEMAPAAAGIAGMGANMALRRDLALRIGGFDPRLDSGTATCSGGDTDMFARLLDAGTQIVYTPEAVVWHRHRREKQALQRCIFGYGVGLYAFLTKRLVEQRDLRAIEIGARWWVGPLIKAAGNWVRGHECVSAGLLVREAFGALVGPFSYWQEVGHARSD